MQEIFSLVLSFVLIIIFLWFTYSIANIIVTFFRCRKQDHSLQLCLNTGGLIFYVILTKNYLFCFIKIKKFMGICECLQKRKKRYIL